MKALVYSLLFAFTLVACTDILDSAPAKECYLHGYAQKGQFVKGSQVTAFAVTSDLVATGESFPSNISDDLGSFSISGKTSAPYLELRAEGYYFNELEGTVSSNPLYLEAFVKADDSASNINLMTTAIRPRVKKLIKAGKSYDEAVDQAQNELLTAIGFTGAAVNFDEMDITGETDADGMLLAFACLVQCGRSASEVTTFIQEIASDIENDGQMSATVFDKLKSKGGEVNPYSVIENLAKYYMDKKLSVNTVPAFYRYVDKKYDLPFFIVDDRLISDKNIPVSSETYGIQSPDQIEDGLYVLATINFTVEVDVEGATVNKTQLMGPLYYISVIVPANESTDSRTAHVTFRDAMGTVLDQAEFVQGGKNQYLIIRYGNTITKASISSPTNPFQEGVDISVNGDIYRIERRPVLGGELGVVVPKADSYLVTYPVGKVSSGGHISRVTTTVSDNQTTEPEMYYYGALARLDGFPLGNPGVVRMQPCLAVINPRFNFDSIPDDFSVQVSDIEISPVSPYEHLAGTASFVVNEQDKYYFSNLNPNIEFETTKHSIKLGLNDTKSAYCVTFPQSLSEGLKIYFMLTITRSGTRSARTLSTVIPETTQLRAGILYGVNVQVGLDKLHITTTISEYAPSDPYIIY